MTREESELRRELKELSDEDLKKYAQIAMAGMPGKKLAVEELASRHLRPKANAYWSRIIQSRMAILSIICVAIIGMLLFRWLYRGDSAPNQTNSASRTQPQPGPSK